MKGGSANFEEQKNGFGVQGNEISESTSRQLSSDELPLLSGENSRRSVCPLVGGNSHVRKTERPPRSVGRLVKQGWGTDTLFVGKVPKRKTPPSRKLQFANRPGSTQTVASRLGGCGLSRLGTNPRRNTTSLPYRRA